MSRKSKITIVLAIIFGVIHFIVVGIPFIKAGGGGEELLYIIIIDFPLYWMAELLLPGSLYNSVAFNFWLFPIAGTIMYAAVGYFFGMGVAFFKNHLVQMRAI